MVWDERSQRVNKKKHGESEEHEVKTINMKNEARD